MNDRWLKAAFSDDKVVAELLLRLHQPPPSTSSSSSQPPPPPQHALPPWGQKRPRSTPLVKYSTTATATRFSPRTPLSWSGGAATASPSDGACDESSVSSASRSKNFSQLKEETEFLEERVNLKRDLKSVHVNLKERRNTSENLKRIKFDLNQQSIEGGTLPIELEVLSANHHRKMGTSTANLHRSILPRHANKDKHVLANSCGMQEVAETKKRGFVVPDLNMPVEDEIATDVW